MAGVSAAVCFLGTLLIHINNVYGEEFCMGYFDSDGEYHQGFSCSSSCCGEGENQYCCSRTDIEVFDNFLLYVIIGCVVGGVLVLALLILLCCCCCAGCPAYKNRMISRGQVIRTQQSNGNMYQHVPSPTSQYPPGQTNVYTPPPGSAPGYPQGYPPSQPYPPTTGYPAFDGTYPQTQVPAHFGEVPSIEMDKVVEASAPPPPYDYNGGGM